jgi:hypothetical protein
MKKTILAIAAAATIAVGTLAAPTTADAQHHGHHGHGSGAAIGLGILGGVIVGGAIANAYGPRYAPAPGYVYYEGYAEPYPIDCPGGHWRRRPVAFDAYGNPIRWSRARFVCP